MSEKDTGRVWRNPCADFVLLFLFLLRDHNSTHSSPSDKNAATVGYVSDQKTPLDLAFKNFTGGWSHRYPMPITYQNFRLPEGKLVKLKSYFLCK